MSLTVTPAEIVRLAEASGNPGLMARHASWERVDLGDIADILNGAAFSSEFFNRDGIGPPLIRIRDVGKSGSDTYYSGSYEDRYIVNPGDVLIGMDGDFRVSRWRGRQGLLNQRVCKIIIRNDSYFDAQFLTYALQGYLDAIREETSSITVKHLSSRSVAQIPLPLPPIAEQRRIVAGIDEHLSRLDAATMNVKKSLERLRHLFKQIIISSAPEEVPSHWKVVPVGDAGKVELGRQRHPDWHKGPHMRPYLRVANVFEDRIDASDLMEMNFPPEIFEKFRVREGDILLNEGQSPEYLGRPALYRGHPENVAFTNSLLRFQAGPGVDPEWALLVFRRHMHSQRFIRELRITTNIAHLSAGRLKSVEFPIPPLDEQHEIVTRVKNELAHADRLKLSLEECITRSNLLRRHILRLAFSGILVPQDLADEPASVLLDRIQIEKAAARPKVGRGSRTKKSVGIQGDLLS